MLKSYPFLFNARVVKSIIVPVYNAENFLDKCIKSVQSQTLQDFELRKYS